MSTSRNLHVRAARDRAVDLLGLGETSPLQDVTVTNETSVDYDHTAVFEIQPGQVNVRYELYELKESGDLVDLSLHADGPGEPTRLHGPKITAVTTFQIRAVKIATELEPAPSAWLLGTRTLKVGIDTGRRASLRGVSRLHPGLVSPSVMDPWITDHGEVVEVQIEDAQAGMRYHLEYPGPGGGAVVTEPMTGTGGTLSLSTQPVEEDTVIRIRVTRTLGPDDDPADATALLKAELPLAVRADPGLAVSIAGSSLVDPTKAVPVTIAGSQTSVMYSVYAHAVRDEDFVRDRSAVAPVIPVPVPRSPDLPEPDVPEHDVLVPMPQRPDPWVAQDGYTQQGEPKPGNGGPLTLTPGPLPGDGVLVIRAHKEHFAAGVAGTTAVIPGSSTLQLQGALVALPRPEPVPGLTLTLTPTGDGSRGRMLVSGGQPGVFYHFRVDPGGRAIGLPAYFHRLAEEDAQQNRGIGHLEIGIDFALARDPDLDPAAPPVSPELAHPPDPMVDVEPLPGVEVRVMAVKARTGVGWPEVRSFRVTTRQEP